MREDKALFLHFDPAFDGKLLRLHETVDHGSEGAVAFKRVARCQRNAVIAASSDASDGLSGGQWTEGHSRLKLVHMEESVFTFGFGEGVLEELMRMVSVYKLEGKQAIC